MKKLVLLVSLPMSLLGCGVGETSELDIVNGAGIQASEYPSVVNIGGCTGTFLDGNLLITAAHCVDSSDTIRYYKSSSEFIESSRIEFPSEYNSSGQGQKDFSYDIALVWFDGYVAPALSDLCKEDAISGQTLTHVGFGCNDWDQSTDGELTCTGAGLTKKRKGTNTIDQLDDFVSWEGLFSNDTGNGTDTSAGKGDSGGPVFVQQGGKSCQIGVGSHAALPRTTTINTYYTNIRSSKSKSFLIEHHPDAQCDVFQEECLNLAIEAYRDIFSKEPTQEEKEAMVQKLSGMKLRDLRKEYLSQIVSKLIPITALLLM